MNAARAVSATFNIPHAPLIPDTTEVLPGTTLQYLTSVSDTGAFTFSQGSAALSEVGAGDIISGSPSSAAPNGFLRKVTAVTIDGGQTVVQTSAATLDEAIQQGEAHLIRALTPAQVQSAVYAPGVSAAPQTPGAHGAVFTLDINDVVLYDMDGDPFTTDDQLKADGSLEVEPSFNFDLQIKNWRLEQLSFSETVREKVTIEVKSKIFSESVQAEKELARYTFSPVTVMVGNFPVVIVPVLTLVVGVDGSLEVSVTTQVSEDVMLTGGLQYAGNAWSPIKQETHEFSWQPPTLSASLIAKGYAGPRLMILLYGILGPQIKLDGYVELEANLFETPWWKLYAGVQLSAGVTMEVLSKTIADYEFPSVIGVKWKLAQASSPPDYGDMVPVPAGNFWMGCDAAHNNGFSCTSNELPLHQVYLDGYLIDKYEVSNAKYAECVTAGGCQVPLNFSSYTRPSYYGNPTYKDYPVIQVDWDRANAYCAWAGKHLPSEAQWEKAARGSSARAYPWGDIAPDATFANYNYNLPDTTQVGIYPKGVSLNGAFDMAGNVWEWVNDWYQSDYYSSSPASNPPGPATGTEKVLRSGGFTSPADRILTGDRNHWGPSAYAITYGFRCAR
jgi:formylglycine-generating enzyme required for sulfatase activity